MSDTEVLRKAISVVSTTDKSVDSAEKTPFYKQQLSTLYPRTSIQMEIVLFRKIIFHTEMNSVVVMLYIEQC